MEAPVAKQVNSSNLKGIYLEVENKRFYPKRELGAHVLGFVDVDEKGLGGIEREYDNLIRGQDEKIVVLQDARRVRFEAADAQREPGVNVVLTLDRRSSTSRSGNWRRRSKRTHAPAGSVIVQDPTTGAILALANWPKFNPNSAAEVAAEKRNNRSHTAKSYEPGSTFKLITLSRRVRPESHPSPEEVFNCENGAVAVAGHLIHDHKNKFPECSTVAGIFWPNSSDVGAIKIALRLRYPKILHDSHQGR